MSVVSEVNVTGILAQFGRGMIQDVSDQMFERFTAAVRAELETAGADRGPRRRHRRRPPPATAPASEPIQAVSFGAEVAGRTARRWAQSPGFWIGLAVLAIAALLAAASLNNGRCR